MGDKTARVGRQYLNNIGKMGNGVVSVQTVWADEHQYYPLHVESYTPAHWFTRGKQDARFRTRPQIALELIKEAIASGVPFRAVVGDSFYGENDQLRISLMMLAVGYVMSLKPSHSWWHVEGTPGSVWELAQCAPWQPDAPGKWHAVTCRFRDVHEETWSAHCGRLGRTTSPVMPILIPFKSSSPTHPRAASLPGLGESQTNGWTLKRCCFIVERMKCRASTYLTSEPAPKPC